MRLDCLDDADAFIKLAPEWEALLENAVTQTVFLRPFWQKAWWDAYGAGKELALITIRRDDGSLAGIAPFFAHRIPVEDKLLLPPVSIERPLNPAGSVERRVLHPIGGTEVSDYLDLVVAQSDANAVYEQLWRYLHEERTDWDLWDLHCIPAASPTLKAIPELAAAAGYAVKAAREEVCPIVELPGDFEEYLATLDKKQRHEIRRKMRKAYREVRVEWRKTDSEERLDADLNLFLTLHQASDVSKAAFWNEETLSFFKAVTRGLFDDGRLELSFMYFDDVPVATLYCFTEGSSLLVYNSGYEPERYRALSAGLVLLGEVIQDAIARGCKTVDFLRGDERYKYDFGGVDHEIFRIGISPEAGP